MQTAKNFLKKNMFTLLSGCFLVLIFQSCEKSLEPGERETGGNDAIVGKKRNTPPPPPPPFYFTDCNNPTYSASIPKGIPANLSITKNYVNSPGGSYGAFTSATVNGVTISATAGTFNTGSGSVVFTITGTPVNTGFFNVWIQVGNIQPCMMFFIVNNAPVSGPTADPGPVAGSTGIINFIYRGNPVAYSTVRARDGKIWLQQNLGSPQVAFHHLDEGSYGDYFQWGRWDDGHQVPNSPVIAGGPSLFNPSHIAAGNLNFITGPTAATKWWGMGGLSTDSWTGSSATSTNGKDPCTALGPGWRMPTATDWQTLKNNEDLEGVMAAFMSNLKLTGGGFRDGYGGFVFKNGDNSNYWSGTASGNNATVLNIDDNTYSAVLRASERGYGYNCRCVKN